MAAYAKAKFEKGTARKDTVPDPVRKSPEDEQRPQPTQADLPPEATSC